MSTGLVAAGARRMTCLFGGHSRARLLAVDGFDGFADVPDDTELTCMSELDNTIGVEHKGGSSSQ